MTGSQSQTEPLSREHRSQECGSVRAVGAGAHRTVPGASAPPQRQGLAGAYDDLGMLDVALTGLDRPRRALTSLHERVASRIPESS